RGPADLAGHEDLASRRGYAVGIALWGSPTLRLQNLHFASSLAHRIMPVVGARRRPDKHARGPLAGAGAGGTDECDVAGRPADSAAEAGLVRLPGGSAGRIGRQPEHRVRATR